LGDAGINGGNVQADEFQQDFGAETEQFVKELVGFHGGSIGNYLVFLKHLYHLSHKNHNPFCQVELKCATIRTFDG